MAAFDPNSIQYFSFGRCFFNDATATAHLHYSLDEYAFEERYVFHGAVLPLNAERRAALETAMKYLHLAAGISYYKTAVPREIRVAGGGIGPEAARYFNELYFNGLGEFAFRNGLDLRDCIRFPRDGQDTVASSLSLPDVTAIPVGGGKDSAVTIESLRRSGEKCLLFSVGNAKPIEDTCRIAGLPHIVVDRHIDPLLLKLNEQGALNGHVPISAIIAHVIVVAAILVGFRRAALSNERSANTGSLVINGHDVNHQYSKSFAFENMLSTHIREHILASFHYFSYLRPLSELGIARLFAKCEKYHDVFVSCNKAFRISGGAISRWCCACPKCRFVFLVLAPFMPKEKLLAIFGKNLLNDPGQADGFDELLGISLKPFECVGETQECVAAFRLLSRNGEWMNDCIVRRFETELAAQFPIIDTYVEESFQMMPSANLPEGYERLLNDFARS
jgi:hypothetical protein